MPELPESLLYEGIAVDILFSPSKPIFGDLFLICGDLHPEFPPSGSFSFDSLADLQFEQVDDFFGIRSLTDEGDDVPIWLFPLINDEPVHHHPGPFDGVRLEYNILRNPVRRADHFLKCVEGFSDLGSSVLYRNRGIDLGKPPNLTQVRNDIDAVVKHWEAQGIVVGSHDALMIDY